MVAAVLRLIKQQLITAANGLRSRWWILCWQIRRLSLSILFDAVINEAIHDYGLKAGRYIKKWSYRIYTELDQN